MRQRRWTVCSGEPDHGGQGCRHRRRCCGTAGGQGCHHHRRRTRYWARDRQGGRLRARAPMSWASTLPGRLAPRWKLKPATSAELAETGRWSSKRRVRVGAKHASINATSPRCAPPQALATFGRLDILFAEMPDYGLPTDGLRFFADWHDTIDVNLTGTCNAIRAVRTASGQNRQRSDALS